MKKILMFWWLLSIRVVILFVAGILVTYLSDWLKSTGFFNDKPCDRNWGCGMVDTDFTWGARHYLYHFMMVALFVISAVRIGMWGDWFWSDENKKKYDE